jgi:hypothetical protein
MSSYLFAWLTFLGLALGAMANLMLHTLTGGPWFPAVRAPLEAGTRLVPVAALLGLPVIFGMRHLYPITDSGWFDATFFAVRSLIYLALWVLLSLLLSRSRSKPAQKAWSAIGLILYLFSISLAAVDWIGSLMPRWYSTGFGLVVGLGQMLGAMALAIAFTGLRERHARPDSPQRQRFQDLGNLLLMYVLTWAYLAFMQFLIIWVGNLPREISWYVPRLQTGWVGLAIFLVVFYFFAPLAILLSRSAKRSPALMGGLGLAVLGVYVADTYWLVAPSVRPEGFSIAWSDPLALAVAAALWFFIWKPARA